MAKKKKHRIDTSPKESTGLGSLTQLFEAAGFDANDTPQKSPAESPTPSAPSSPDWQHQLSLHKKHTALFLRVERKGRKGKTVTLICGLTLEDQGLRAVARALSKSMGCGSTVEESISGKQIVLQGDVAHRAGQWLTNHGADLKNG